MKIKKILGITLAAAVLSTTTVAFAKPVQQGAVFYKKGSPSDKIVIDGFLDSDNRSKNSQNHVEHVVEITKSFKGTLSGTVEVNAFVAKVSVSTSLEYGTSETFTIKHTWDIDPRIYYVCQWGHRQRNVQGRIDRYIDGRVINSRNVNANYYIAPWFGGKVK